MTDVQENADMVPMMDPQGNHYLVPIQDVQASKDKDGFRFLTAEERLQYDQKKKYGDSALRTFAERASGTATLGLSDALLADPAKTAGKVLDLGKGISTFMADPYGAIVDPLVEALGGTPLPDSPLEEALKSMPSGEESLLDLGVPGDTGLAEEMSLRKKHNPKAAMAGTVTGALASAVAGPGAALGKLGGKAAGAAIKGEGILASALRGTAVGGIEGAAYEAGMLISEDALGETEITRDSIMAHAPGVFLGAGLGGVLGRGVCCWEEVPTGCVKVW